jgi:DNA-binding CsgD family transcriptional regulator
VAVAATAIWELGAVEFAAAYRRLARTIVAAGIPDFPALSNDLTVARMAGLLGDLAEAEAAFARARVVLDAAGQRTLRAIVDYDEALVLANATPLDRPRVARLLAAAADQFAARGMDGWLARVVDQQRRLDLAPRSAAPSDPAYPDRLTAREAAVLRLVASGETNREVAAELGVSVPTVERHLANIYAKIGARNRVDATAYALSHGLAPARPPG